MRPKSIVDIMNSVCCPKNKKSTDKLIPLTATIVLDSKNVNCESYSTVQNHVCYTISYDSSIKNVTFYCVEQPHYIFN